MKSVLIDQIISNLKKNYNITIEDLENLRNAKYEDIDYLFSISEINKNYIIKSYLTVCDPIIINKLFNKKSNSTTNNLATCWIDEILGQEVEDIVSSYICVSLFSSNVLEIVRTGISNIGKEYLMEFEQQIYSLINFVTKKEDYILSKVYNLKDINNQVFLENFQAINDKETFIMASKILETLKICKMFIDNYNNSNLFNKEIDDLLNEKNNEHLRLVKKIVPNYILENIKKKENKAIKSENFLNKESIDDVFPEIKVEKRESDFSISNFFDKNKKSKFKIEKLKKRGNLKIIIISLFLIIIGLFLGLKVIQIEIEKNNKIINKEIIKSDIPVEININEKT